MKILLKIILNQMNNMMILLRICMKRIYLIIIKIFSIQNINLKKPQEVQTNLDFKNKLDNLVLFYKNILF